MHDDRSVQRPLQKDIAVHIGAPEAQICSGNLRALLGLDQIEQMSPALDPVVADYGPRRAILEGVAASAAPQGSEPVLLIHHPGRLGVGIVLEERPRNPVAVDMVPLGQDVT